MGAVGEDGVRVINREVVHAWPRVSQDTGGVAGAGTGRCGSSGGRYRARRPRLPLNGRMAVVVDDGIATGSTARAACQIARAHGAARVMLAVPVGRPCGRPDRPAAADEMICVQHAARVRGHRPVLRRFPQITDEEVIACLERAATAQLAPGARPVPPTPSRSEEVEPQPAPSG